MGLGLADPPPMLHQWQAMADYRPEPEILELGADFYDAVEPAKFPKAIPRFLNQRWAERVGLEVTDWEAHFCRFEPLPDNLPQPLALRYHGHQFRSYNPEIGDGRGFLFAQLRGEDGRLLDLGTKGSGQTPYSRFGDGRLTLKGGVREVLATEMLEALGVNTSKTFALFETGEELVRGDEPSPTRSSVLTRLGHGHIRRHVDRRGRRRRGAGRGLAWRRRFTRRRRARWGRLSYGARRGSTDARVVLRGIPPEHHRRGPAAEAELRLATVPTRLFSGLPLA